MEQTTAPILHKQPPQEAKKTDNPPDQKSQKPKKADKGDKQPELQKNTDAPPTVSTTYPSFLQKRGNQDTMGSTNYIQQKGRSYVGKKMDINKSKHKI